MTKIVDGQVWVWIKRAECGQLTVTDDIIVCEGPSGYYGPVKIPEHLYESWRRVQDICKGAMQVMETRDGN